MKALPFLAALVLAALAFPVAASAQSASATATASVTFVDPVGVGEVRGEPVASAHVGDKRAQVQTPSYALAGPAGQVVSVETTRNVTLRHASGESLTSDIGPARVSGAQTTQQRVKMAASVALARLTSPGLYTGAVAVMVDYN